jgi:hypothetical protein
MGGGGLVSDTTTVDNFQDDPDDEYRPASLEEQLEAAETNYSSLRAAVQWHLSGADWATIAQRFGYSSPQAARVAVEKFEGDMVDSSDVVAARNKARGRYERLLQSEWYDATHPFLVDNNGKQTEKRNDAHDKALANARGLVGDLVRLDGLGAPTQLQVYVPGSDEIMAVVQELREAKLGEIAREADIFDAEIEEDDDSEAAGDSAA